MSSNFDLVRDKSKELYAVITDPQILEKEREFARTTRDKLQGTQTSVSSNGASVTNPTSYSSAGPASGKYNTGFGSEDINRLGYNDEKKFNAPYDPYTKAQSAPTAQAYVPDSAKTTEPEKRKSKKPKVSVSSSSSSSSDSEDSEEKARKKRRAKKKARLAAKTEQDKVESETK